MPGHINSVHRKIIQEEKYKNNVRNISTPLFFLTASANSNNLSREGNCILIPENLECYPVILASNSRQVFMAKTVQHLKIMRFNYFRALQIESHMTGWWIQTFH